MGSIKKHLLIIIVLLIAPLFILATPATTSADAPLQYSCQQGGVTVQTTTACASDTTTNPFVTILKEVTSLVALVTGIVSVIMIMLGGFMYIVSIGDTSRINTARTTITYAVVGLVIAGIAQAIVLFVIDKL